MPPTQNAGVSSGEGQANLRSQEGSRDTDTDTTSPDEHSREFVEYYPNEGAGAPISSVIEDDFDLGAYIRSCGPFAEPKAFRAAELLISSNLTNAEWTEFLESEVVRQRDK